jgi:drug/metabolite transporter (DMT)-like permease
MDEMSPSERVESLDRWLPAGALSLACILWGSAFYFAKIALVELSVVEVLVYRFGLAAPILAGILVHARSMPAGRDIWLILLTGVLCVPIGYVIHFAGLDRTSVTHASLLVGVAPIFLAVTASLLGLERIGMTAWTAVMLSSVGMVVMIGLPGGDGDFTGDMLILLSMVISTAWILLSQRLARRLGALVATAWILLVGTLALTPFALASGPLPIDLSAQTWFAIAALSLGGTIVAFLLWNWGASRHSAGSAGVFLNLEPVVGGLMGVVLLGEAAGVSGVIGGGIILSAAVLATRSPAPPCAAILECPRPASDQAC